LFNDVSFFDFTATDDLPDPKVSFLSILMADISNRQDVAYLKHQNK
jgi:hypothetical protein